MIGSRWVYKINDENSIGQQRSPSRRGTAISALKKSTWGNEPVSLGMPNIDDRKLNRRVDDDKRSTGTDELKNGAMDHEKKRGGDEGDPQEGELHSGQHRDEVRRKSNSGHSLRFFLALSNSIGSIESAL